MTALPHHPTVYTAAVLLATVQATSRHAKTAIQWPQRKLANLSTKWSFLSLLWSVSKHNVHRDCESAANFNHHAANGEHSINHLHTAYLRLVTHIHFSLPMSHAFSYCKQWKFVWGPRNEQVGLSDSVGTRAETKVIISPSNLQSPHSSRLRLVAYRTRTWNNTRSRTKT